MSVHVYIQNIFLRKVFFRIFVIFSIPMTLVILKWGKNYFAWYCDPIQTYMYWILMTRHVIDFWYEKRICTFHTLESLYCFTSNKHTSCDSFHWTKPIVSVIIQIFLFYWAVGMSTFTPSPHRMNLSMMSLFPQFFFSSFLNENYTSLSI